MTSADTHYRRQRKDDREAEIQRKIVKLFRTLGFIVYSLSQGRRTRQSSGLPDLILKNPARGLSLTMECKASEGRLSIEQEHFADLCRQCGDHHVIGGYDAAVAFLQEKKFIAEGYTP